MSTPKLSLAERVRLVVLDLPEATVGQVLARVARHIPASQAVTAGRRRVTHDHRRGADGLRSPIYTLSHLAERGRRTLVGEALKRLARSGKIRRVARGLYGPPLPKVLPMTAC
jgi:hypothetical protein